MTFRDRIGPSGLCEMEGGMRPEALTTAYACAGLLLALLLARDARTSQWSAWVWTSLVAMWPVYLGAALLRSARLRMRSAWIAVLSSILRWSVRRLEALGCGVEFDRGDATQGP